MQFAFTPPAFLRLFGMPAPRVPVTRLFAATVRHGTTRELKAMPGRVTVHCRSGEAWITHDGDPRDVLLRANESYSADHAGRMRLHATQGDCTVEIQVVG